MNARILVLLLVSLISTNVFAVSVSSRVDSVVVYPQGATVTRVADVSLNAGSNDIRFTGLVNAIDADRLRVEVLAEGVQIGQVNLAREQQRDVYDAEVAAVQEDIAELTSQIAALIDSSAAAKLQLTFLEGIASGYGKDAGYEGARGAADVNSWRSALALLLSGSEEANTLIRRNEKKRVELDKDLSALQRKLNGLRGGSLATTVLDVTLNAANAGRTEVRLRYFQEDASWSPSYEARLDSNTGELQLAQQAEVKQETDEDWGNVILTLSTSEPGGELVAPTLESQFLNLYRPAPEMPAKRRELRAGSADLALQEIVVTGQRVETSVGGFAVTYDMPGRTSVSNDSDEAITLDLARFNFSADMVTVVVPRESEEAFLTARFVYDEALPLYGSNMTVFVDGAFAGYSEMPTALPGSQLELPMGQDRRIEVSAKTQGDARGREGIISKRKTESTDYIFELTNRRSSPSYVEVRDLYPVARNKDIDVDVPKTATSPDVRDVDDEPGLILWKKTLSAGETWRIRHQYTISYPADQVLQTQ